jgi:pimeloyl-ACP methyl ester carboxylesterase
VADTETHYTRSTDGTNLAYQVSGDGPLDLVFHNTTGVPIDLLLEDPGFVRLRRRLDAFSRTVWFDARGIGASEGDTSDYLGGGIFDADLTAVLDAAGSERSALVAEGASGGSAIRFSANHTERVSALVLLNSYAHYVRDDDYPWGRPSESLDRFEALIKEMWGTGAVIELVAPSRIADERFEPGMPARHDSALAPTISPSWSGPGSRTTCARFSPPSRFPLSSCIGRETVTST